MCSDNDIVLVFMQKVINKLIELMPLIQCYLKKNSVLVILFIVLLLHFFAYPFHEVSEKRIILLFDTRPIYPLKKFLELINDILNRFLRGKNNGI